MKTYLVQLVGTSPLLLHRECNHQNREHIAAQAVVYTEESLRAQIFGKMSKNQSGNPAVPIEWIWNSIRNGCRKIVCRGKQLSFLAVEKYMNLPEGFIVVRSIKEDPPEWRTYKSLQHEKPD